MDIIDFSERSTIIRLSVISVLFLIALIGSFKHGRFRSSAFFISLFFIFILPGLAIAFYQTTIYLAKNFHVYKYLFIGLGVGIPFIFLMKRSVGFSTFEHEATHAFIALLFFKRITKFTVNRFEGGSIQYKGGLNGSFFDHMISLAPYYLPLFAFIFVLVRPLLGSMFFPWWDIWIGIWITWYLFTYFSEIRSQWSNLPFISSGSHQITKTDIAQEGFIFSTIFILTFSLLLYGILFNVIFNNYTGILDYLKEIYYQNFFFYRYIFN